MSVRLPCRSDMYGMTRLFRARFAALVVLGACVAIIICAWILIPQWEVRVLVQLGAVVPLSMMYVIWTRVARVRPDDANHTYLVWLILLGAVGMLAAWGGACIFLLVTESVGMLQILIAIGGVSVVPMVAVAAILLARKFGSLGGNTCRACGYDLSGLPTRDSIRCPECGVQRSQGKSSALYP